MGVHARLVGSLKTKQKPRCAARAKGGRDWHLPTCILRFTPSHIVRSLTIVILTVPIHIFSLFLITNTQTFIVLIALGTAPHHPNPPPYP